MTVRDMLIALPLARQLTVDRRGLGRAAQSKHSRQLAPRIRGGEMTQSICPYCAVGCGQRVYHRGGEVIQIEGDPDSPISRGRLCPKGAASAGLVNNPLREYKLKYRRPYGTEWEDLSLDQAMDMLADRVIAARRAHLGGRRRDGRRARQAQPYARLCPPRRRDARQRGELPHQEAVHRARRDPGREPGAYMTLLHGPESRDLVRARRRHRLPAGPAELRLHRHPGLEHGREPPGRLPVGDGGQGTGAKLIHVDPRFTRTSAMADLHVPIRAGSDIAFLGRIINHILENGREFRDYVVAYTNAAVIINEQFADTEDLDGLFAGWDPEWGSYDTSTWQYEGMDARAAAGRREQVGSEAGGEEQSHGAHGAGLSHAQPPSTDPTLEHPRCVYQLLKRHYSRYTPEMVERICGVPREQLVEVAEALCQNSGRERTSAFAYAVGWTQHTVGVQYIRGAAALAGGAATLAGAACERWAIFRAGFESARDPKYTVLPQRRRVEERRRAAADGAPARS